MNLTCAILDDDPLFTDIIEHFLKEVDGIKVNGVYHSAMDALKKINFNQTDLLFLDMEMPGIDGMEFLKSLTIVPALVIVSGKKIYGPDAFEYNAIDYLCKPVSFPRFMKAVNKIKAHFERSAEKVNGDRKNIFIKHDGVHVRLPVEDICMVRAQDNDVSIITNDRTYKVHLKLKDIYDMLPHVDFMQVHRSFIVQLAKIDKVDGEVIEINKRTIPVSRTYLSDLYTKLKIK